MPPRVEDHKPVVKVRVATPEEASAVFAQPGYDTHVIVIEDDGVITGHVCVSETAYGVFGHNLECHSADPHSILKLGRKAKEYAKKKLGASEIFVHVEVPSERRLLDFWLHLGFKPVYTMLKLDI